MNDVTVEAELLLYYYKGILNQPQQARRASQREKGKRQRERQRSHQTKRKKREFTF